MDLKAIYLTALERCAPDVLVRAHVTRDMPRNVVAIGKCAGALLDGVAAVHEIDDAFVAIPEGYRLPATRAHVHVGGHPHMTRASFDAGRALLAFVDAHEDILFLISGGGSACLEVPLVDEVTVANANAKWIASGMSIGEINARRRTMSAIKGGKLAARVRGRAVTLVYSDVSTGALHDVASGPTVPGSEAVLVADNTTLVRAAAQTVGDVIPSGVEGPGRAGRQSSSSRPAHPGPSTSLGMTAVMIEEQIEGDVEDAARMLAERAAQLRPGQILVAGGEPTVVVRGDGRGGRCSELAVRFAMLSACEAVFASSDGVDGNSGVAGIHLKHRPAAGGPAGWQPALQAVVQPALQAVVQPALQAAVQPALQAVVQAALQRSDSFSVAVQVGEPIMIAPTGNNLRDLFLVACV